jgi:hypothetical protein
MPDQTDYPQGDGQLNCPKCRGRGVVAVALGHGPEGARPCDCVMVRDVLANVNRGWPGLTNAAPIPNSPLKGKTEMDFRITGSLASFREHLRHVACRMGPSWNFKVVSDSDMMEAWLATVGDDDLIDADVGVARKSAIRSQFLALVDLIEPPKLLIILCGVKAARNSAMPEVLLEALRHRQYLSKPTWVVDQPYLPLAAGHLSWNPMVGDFLAQWPYLKLGESSNAERVSTPTPPSGIQIMTLDDADKRQDGGTRDLLASVEANEKAEKKTKRGGKR